MNVITFKHSALSGDLIYSLSTIKKACEKYEAKAIVYQWLNRKVNRYEGAIHETMDKDGNMVTMNEEIFAMMKPLIESLPFIHSFESWEGQQIVVDLDKKLQMKINMPHGAVNRWNSYAFPDLYVDISEKVFEVEKNPLTEGAIIVNRTGRYQNPNISYAFINRLGLPVFFAGTLSEYSDFKNEVPKSKYLKVENFLQLAQHISSCKVFVGNQSMCFAIAESMKTPRILESSYQYQNVIPTGPNGYDFFLPEAFEYLLNEMVK